jgi:hypothetical protein
MNGNDDWLTVKMERIRRRRRGWAWTLLVSMVVGVAAVIMGMHYFSPASASQAAGEICVGVLLAAAAIAVVSLVVVFVESVRLWGHIEVAREHQAAQAGHPLPPSRTRNLPQPRASWLLGVGLVAGLVGLAVYYLPAQVDAVTFLAGAQHKATFVPLSYGQVCDKYANCHPITYGVLDTNGHPHVSVPGTIPLWSTTAVDEPTWTWGAGNRLFGGDFAAWETIIFGTLFGDGLAGGAVALLIWNIRKHVRKRHAKTRETSSAASNA